MFFFGADFASPYSIGGEAVPDNNRLPVVHSVSQLQGGSFRVTERKRLPRCLQLAAASAATWWASLCVPVKVFNSCLKGVGLSRRSISPCRKTGRIVIENVCWVAFPF